MTLKQNLHSECSKFLNTRLKGIQNTIKDIQISLQSETKSSAGDKHETGRAMLQLEREKAGEQLAEVQKLQAVLYKINPEHKQSKVVLGSIVYTTTANYFIAVSVGKLTIEHTDYFAISLATPIAKALYSKSVGDVIQFRDTVFTITAVQ